MYRGHCIGRHAVCGQHYFVQQKTSLATTSAIDEERMQKQYHHNIINIYIAEDATTSLRYVRGAMFYYSNCKRIEHRTYYILHPHHMLCIAIMMQPQYMWMHALTVKLLKARKWLRISHIWSSSLALYAHPTFGACIFWWKCRECLSNFV